MPLFTINTQKQLRASSAGVLLYPEVPTVKVDNEIGDVFERTNLNPSNIFALYTETENGSGGSAIDNSIYTLTTGNAATNDRDTRTSGLDVRRTSDFFDTRTAWETDVIFRVPTATSVEGFIGLEDNGQLSALPTTTQHLGVYWDISEGANFILSSSEGSSQPTTDTGDAVDTNARRLNIQYTGADAAVIRLYSGTNFDTLEGTHTVTSLWSGAASEENFTLHFFVQTETTAARTLDIREWKMKFT